MRCSRAGTKLLKFARAASRGDFKPDMINSGNRAAAHGWYARRARARLLKKQMRRPLGFFVLFLELELIIYIGPKNRRAREFQKLLKHLCWQRVA
jgi:hypothetical protein